MKRTFRAKTGATFGQEKAQIYGDVIASWQLKDVNAEDVLERARGTELEEYFEWDDAKAAYAHRLQQSRQLLNHLIEVTPDANGNLVEIQAFTNLVFEVENPVTKEIEPFQTYRRTVDIINSPDKELLLEQIMSRFINMREKYKVYREFDPIFAAIDKVSKDLK